MPAAPAAGIVGIVAAIVGASMIGSMRAIARITPPLAIAPAAVVMVGLVAAVVPPADVVSWGISSIAGPPPPHAATSSQLSPKVISTRFTLLIASLSRSTHQARLSLLFSLPDPDVIARSEPAESMTFQASEDYSSDRPVPIAAQRTGAVRKTSAS
jgi:hypothetical protein